MSSYNPNIPQGTDPILQSAAQMRANFQVINQVFSGNHTVLTGDPEILGMHYIITMRPTASMKDPTTGTGEVALYNKLVSGVPNLFFRPENNATPIRMTFNSIVNTGLAQYSFMAGPFIVFYGFILAPTHGQIITLSQASSLIFADLTMAFLLSGGSASIPTIANATLSGNTFTINYPTNFTFNPSGGVYYFAVGLP